MQFVLCYNTGMENIKNNSFWFVILVCAFGLFNIINSVSANTLPLSQCTISNTLRLGSTGSEVVCLQTRLGGLTADGKFGPKTKNAVVVFQTSHSLTPDGIFGPRSLVAWVKIPDGCIPGFVYSPTTGQPCTLIWTPVLDSIDAPTTLAIKQTGTWTVHASDPQNGTLSYSVDWGEYPSLTTIAGEATMASFIQTATFTHSYSVAGIYTVRFTVKNSVGFTNQSSVTVQVGNSTIGALNITSPNGGETWVKGTTKNITWTSPQYFRATYADLKLVPYYQPCTGQVCPMGADASMMYPYRIPYTIATGISINQNSYSWNVGNVFITDVPSITIAPVGDYTIQICETGTSNCDSSDTYFSIQ